MITNILVLNRDRVETAIRNKEKASNWYLISIYGKSPELLTKTNTEILTEMGCKKAISLEFWDLTPEDLTDQLKQRYPNVVLFNEDHAKRIINFLDEIKNCKEPSLLIVHCDAGISRSGAVGEFASDYFGLSYEQFCKDNDVLPNAHIKALLRRMAC